MIVTARIGLAASGFNSLMRAPIAVGFVKSNGVPFTDLISPVGIIVASTGVYLSAAIMT